MIIGVDFDNTIVNYDELMHSIAVDWGLVGRTMSRNKRRIRDAVRSLPDGEVQWQRLQAAAYGLRMSEAVPAKGVKGFFLACRQRDIPVLIVSHKSMYTNLGESQVNFHTAALAWLEQEGFFASGGIGVARTDVHFAPSRAEKIARIRQLAITHFIDDLEETFSEAEFPGHVEKILYSTNPSAHAQGVTRLASWARIREYLLQDAPSAHPGGRIMP